MHPNGIHILTIGGLHSAFLIALLTVTLVFLRQDIRPEKDNIAGLNKTMLDFVEYGHWVVAGFTGIGVVLTVWAVMTHQITFGAAHTSRKRAEAIDTFESISGIPGFSLNSEA